MQEEELPDELVVRFVDITGAEPDRARELLLVANADLETAVMLYWESNDQRPASPIHRPAQHDPQLLSPDLERHQEYAMVDSDFSMGIIGRQIPVDDDDDVISKLYKQPFEIMYTDGFEDARHFAQSCSKLILIAVYTASEFSSLRLNKDLWGEPAIQEYVQENFVFLQFEHFSEQGLAFQNLYPFDGINHLCVIDPLTGERMWKSETVRDQDEFFNQVGDFIDVYENSTHKRSSANNIIVIDDSDDEPQEPEDPKAALKSGRVV